MSYILDALRNSDQERSKGTVPDLQSQPERMLRPLPAPSRSFLKSRLYWSVLPVLAALLYFGLSRPPVIHDGSPSLPAPDATPVTIPAAELAPPVEIGTQQQPPDSNGEVDLDALKDVRIHIAPVSDAADEASSVSRSDGPESLPASTDVRVPDTDSSGEPAETASEQSQPPDSGSSVSEPDRYRGIPHQRQLPIELQRALPDIDISVHRYTPSPSSRFVRINRTTHREGDLVDNQLMLEEITPDGVIMAFRDNRFWRHIR